MVLGADIMQWLMLGGVMVGILTASTVAYAILRSTLQSTTNSLWERNAAALEARVQILEDQEAECKRELEHIKMVNVVLSDQVSGAAAVAKLEIKIDNYFSDVKALLGGKRQGD